MRQDASGKANPVQKGQSNLFLGGLYALTTAALGHSSSVLIPRRQATEVRRFDGRFIGASPNGEIMILWTSAGWAYREFISCY